MMMSHYEFKTLPGEPIVVGTLFDSFSYQDDIQTVLDELTALLDAASEPIIYVNDLREFGMSMNDVIDVSSRVARGANAVLHHPNLKAYVIVTQKELFRLAARGLNSPIFGFTEISAFDTLDEALAFARSQV